MDISMDIHIHRKPAQIGISSQICEIFESRYLEKYEFDQREI